MLKKGILVCCEYGPHICYLCGRDFYCDEDRKDLKNLLLNRYAYCKYCEKYIPRRTACFSCFERFKTRGELFKHLKNNSSHVTDYPKICPKCKKRVDIGRMEEHLYYCCKHF